MKRRTAVTSFGALTVSGLSGCLGYTLTRKSKIDRLEQRIDKLESQVQSKNQTITQLRNELESLREKSESLEKKEQRIKELEQKVNQLESELNEITKKAVEPVMVLINLVSSWSSFGDAVANAIDSAKAGEDINIAYRYRIPIHNSTLKVFTQTEIWGPNGNQKAVRTNTFERVDSGDTTEYESYRKFSTTGWTKGEYKARAFVRDDVTGKVSDPVSTTFELN